MRIVGVDWAAQPKNRGLVVLELEGGRCRVVEAHGRCDGETLTTIMAGPVEVLAVDIPFGWPADFRALVSEWRADAPKGVVPDGKHFALRETDRLVHARLGKMPLSVSSDRIALAARSWFSWLAGSGLGDHVDAGSRSVAHKAPHLIEVYPAATLRALRIESAKYKKDESARTRVVDAVLEALGIKCAENHRGALNGSKPDASHAADALFAAASGLLYVEPRKGWTVCKPEDDTQRARALEEGWIYFPIAT